MWGIFDISEVVDVMDTPRSGKNGFNGMPFVNRKFGGKNNGGHGCDHEFLTMHYLLPLVPLSHPCLGLPFHRLGRRQIMIQSGGLLWLKRWML